MQEVDLSKKISRTNRTDVAHQRHFHFQLRCCSHVSPIRKCKIKMQFDTFIFNFFVAHTCRRIENQKMKVSYEDIILDFVVAQVVPPRFARLDTPLITVNIEKVFCRGFERNQFCAICVLYELKSLFKLHYYYRTFTIDCEVCAALITVLVVIGQCNRRVTCFRLQYCHFRNP